MGAEATDNGSTGGVLRLIREGRATSRADLIESTGLTRSTVGARVDSLIAADLVREVGSAASTGGRPRNLLAFNSDAGVILAADLGATHCRLEVTDLAGRALVDLAEDLAIAEGPEAVLGHVQKRFGELLAQVGRDATEVCGVGVGVPGPVDAGRRTTVTPPIMPGWDGVAIPDLLDGWGGAPVLVDNDVNIMALGEHRTAWPDTDHLLFVKVGTGIGCGIIVRGRIHRGPQGAAGDIGHIRVSGHSDVVCACGNVACLEAVAAGGALARRLGVANSRAVVDQARAGNTEAVHMVREAGRLIGEVLAGLVNFFNPQVIVLGGDVAEAHEQLLAGIREAVYQRSLPLATRHLRIVHSKLGDRAGATGAAHMVVEHVLSDAAVAATLAGVRA